MNNKDSVLRDTHKEGAPFQMLLQVPPFKGSYEEGLTMLGKGDSAKFYVSADWLFTRAMQPLPPGVRCDVTARQQWMPSKGLLVSGRR